MPIEQGEHEGRRLLALLRRHKKKQADFARAAGVSTAATSKLMQVETIGAGQWAKTVDPALRKLEIDPQELRPSTTLKRERFCNLSPLTRDFSERQIRSLLEILEADPDDVAALVMVLRDRLERQH